jgi:hypothetical protein
MSTTTIRPLKSTEAHTCMLPTNHVKSMVKAMRSVEMFEIEENYDYGTVKATFTDSKGQTREVFAAIAKSANGPWIIRHHKELFTA